jgi:hypothetical protein
MFCFARFLKAFEVTTGADVSDDLENAFNLWWVLALPKLSPEELSDREKYLIDLERMYEVAHSPHGANALQAALRAAPSIPCKATASDQMTRLRGVCVELQRLSGSSPFFISVRGAAVAMQTNDTRFAHNALAALVRRKFLTIVEKGTPKGRKATRYRIV